jgi:LPXTG-site transpeptidase (sortase) family protein
VRRYLSILLLLAMSVALSQGAASAAAKPPKPPTLSIPAGWPQYLLIPRFSVQAPVEALALTSPKDVHAPYKWGDVAWFDRGNKPGTYGRSVMFGHVDSTCCPAVFYHLKDLNKGDVIEVQYKKGIVKFQVMWQHSYTNDKLPADWLFAQVHERGLSLITCSGAFNTTSGYDHKLVVYARAILPNGKLA